MNEKEVEKTPETKPLGPPKSVAREYFESFVVTLIMAIFGMTFILQAVTVPTGSMQNTILVGDYLLVNKFIFAPGGKPLPFLPQREIERGDIVVFKFPGYPDELHKSAAEKEQAGVPYQTNFVKRVIGLPGDTVEFRNDQVYINNELLPEHRIVADSPRTRGGENDQAALQVKSEEPPKPGETHSVYYSADTMELAEKNQLPPGGGNLWVMGKLANFPCVLFFVLGLQPRPQPRQPLLGLCLTRLNHRTRNVYLLVLRPSRVRRKYARLHYKPALKSHRKND